MRRSSVFSVVAVLLLVVPGAWADEGVAISVEDLPEASCVFAPASAHFGSMTIRARVGASSSELFAWWEGMILAIPGQLS